MSTCPCCHQAIPQTCDRCPEQIIFRDGDPVSYQNHFKSKLHRESVNGKAKQEVRAGKASLPGEMIFRKPPVATAEEQQSLIDAIKEQSG